MYLNEKIEKWQEKFDEGGPMSPQSYTCFLVQNWSFGTFSLFTKKNASLKREILHKYSLCMCFFVEFVVVSAF
jgi:hypothetical protein